MKTCRINKNQINGQKERALYQDYDNGFQQ